MSSSGTKQQDDSWYVNVDCPKYFDFASALQAPCSTQLTHNPPLHDFVYESDDESRRFFRAASIHTFSPHQKQSQKPLLDPREFGDPIYRHRPETSFEAFLSEFEAKRKGTNGDHKESTPSSLPRSRRTFHSTSSSVGTNTASLRRPRALGRLGYLIDEDNDDDQDLTANLKTPTLDSIITPISVRRHAPLLTPSRIFHPVNISKELFPNSFDSPVFKQPRSATKLRGTPSRVLAESLYSPSLEAPQRSDDKDVKHHPTTTPTTMPSSTPLRNVTPISQVCIRSSNATPSANEKASNKSSHLRDNRAAKLLQEQKLRPPRRAARASSSTASAKSNSPPVQLSLSTNRTKDLSVTGDVDGVRTSPDAVPDYSTMVTTHPSLSLQSPPSVSSVTNDEADNSGEEEDLDLIRRVHEHNMRLRKSERVADIGLLSLHEGEGQQGKAPSSTGVEGPFMKMNIANCENSHISETNHSSYDQITTKSNIHNDRHPQSLQDLLQMENGRVLRERKQKLPERRKLVQASKDIVLKKAERNNLAPQAPKTRVSTTVEFTPVDNLESTTARSRRDGSTRTNEQKGITQAATRGTPSIPKPVSPLEPGYQKDQNYNPNVPPPRGGTGSRQPPKKASMTDQIKASAKQRRQEKRLENDLQSMLSQHNRRVQSNRRLQA